MVIMGLSAARDRKDKKDRLRVTTENAPQNRDGGKSKTVAKRVSKVSRASVRGVPGSTINTQKGEVAINNLSTGKS